MNKFIIVLCIICQVSFSQEKKEDFEYIYILTNRSNFIGELLRYQAVFYVKSEEESFLHDNYYFDIRYKGLDFEHLYELGEKIDIDTVNYVTAKDFFKEKTNCELHRELSLLRKNRKGIVIVTKIPDSPLLTEKGVVDGNYNTKEYMAWPATYSGTQKDVMHTQMGKGYFR
ncbi:MAG: hypothetical protein HRT69_02605 [Flavobacteriaceae bacterium]|nr:hypothetical protein [Flavobacteriaceae bacterium]